MRIKPQQLQAKRRIYWSKKGYICNTLSKPIPVRTGISTPKQEFFEIRETKQQLRGDSRVGGPTPGVENENKYVRSREHTSEQLTQVQEKTNIILSPLDVKFADNFIGDFYPSMEIKSENILMNLFNLSPEKKKKLSLKIFKYQGKFYSEDVRL